MCICCASSGEKGWHTTILFCTHHALPCFTCWYSVWSPSHVHMMLHPGSCFPFFRVDSDLRLWSPMYCYYYIFMCFVYVCWCRCSCIAGFQRASTGAIPHTLYTFLSRQDVSLACNLPWWARLACLWAPEICRSLLHPYWKCKHVLPGHAKVGF